MRQGQFIQKVGEEPRPWETWLLSARRHEALRRLERRPLRRLLDLADLRRSRMSPSGSLSLTNRGDAAFETWIFL